MSVLSNLGRLTIAILLYLSYSDKLLPIKRLRPLMPFEVAPQSSYVEPKLLALRGCHLLLSYIAVFPQLGSLDAYIK